MLEPHEEDVLLHLIPTVDIASLNSLLIIHANYVVYTGFGVT